MMFLFCLGEFIIDWGEYDCHVKMQNIKLKMSTALSWMNVGRKIQERLV